MSWLRSAVHKAVEVGGTGKNNLTRTVRNYADSVVLTAGNAVSEGAKLIHDRIGSRNVKSFSLEVKRLEEVSVSSRGGERVQLLRRWLVSLREVERMSLDQIQPSSEEAKDFTAVCYVDPGLPGEPMTFRDVFLHSEALEGMVLSMILEAPNEEEVQMLLELFGLSLSGEKEVHEAVIQNVQDLAAVFSKYKDEVLKKPVSLMEDGKGCVVLRGLEEEVVYSANDIYALLERGSSKRRTADTLLNKRSSRSHSVFTITVHIKEESMGDEELIKCGKLNLVDLAGSENILRSGSRDGRAREAGEINKSLLTLGRVINALVEHSSHIPYRDSKLTRLLRDSLGGKTKTCIIATISPSAHSLEETLSTLDYAYRAKNIKNKPEANQKLSKAVLLKDLYLELERMKEDVRAARDRNGIYIAQERYAQEEAEKKAKMERIEQLENDLNLTEREASKFRGLYVTEKEKLLDVESDLKDCKRNLDNTNKELHDLKENYIQVISKLKEREAIISRMKASETTLIDRAKGLRSDLQHASNDISSLFTRLDQKDKLESENHSMLLKFGSQLDQNLKELHRTVLGSVSQQQQQLRTMEEHTQSFLAHKYDATRDLESRIGRTVDTYTSGVAALKKLSAMVQKKASFDLENMNCSIGSQIEAVEQLLIESAAEAAKVAEDIRDSLNDQKELLALAARQQKQGLVRSMRSAQEISNTASTIFSNIYNQAHSMVEAIRESQAEKSRQLAAFEMNFKVRLDKL
ncbi:hypothetical protein F2Q68_00028075 [Brassica cretica]|uniref:Kinesin-like protein n=1 Tax=Brassica cretica TaxID=69181 RepID=A0A8S9IHL6_BRACR|nr:hypothetical protein F2Q68_00028075 [Brassica cretica]